MFFMNHIEGRAGNTQVHDVSLSVEDSQVQAVLCPNIDTIDELVHILHEKNAVSQGSMTLDDMDYYCARQEDKVAFVTRKNNLYPNLTVAENIVMTNEKIPFFIQKKKYYQKCSQLLHSIDYPLDLWKKVKKLMPEEQMIVSILRAVGMKPRLLIIDEIHGKLSYNGMACFFRILNMLKKQGTMILYFTSQWEDTVKVGDKVTVIAHGKTTGEYSVKEIEKNPAQIYYIMLGGEKLEESEKQTEILEDLSQGLAEIRIGYNYGNTMKELAKRIKKQLKGNWCEISLIDERNRNFVRFSNQESLEMPKLKIESYRTISEKSGVFYFSINDRTKFYQLFEENDAKRAEAVLGIMLELNGEVIGMICVYYQNYYIYSEKDKIYLELIAREVIMIVENSKLKRSSVLLQESHHRIKNNLQIIISLLQMEKMMVGNTNQGERNESVTEMMDDVIGRIKSIATIHDILAHDVSATKVTSMEEIIEAIKGFYHHAAEIAFDTQKIFVPYNRATSFALVLNELINNSVKHAGNGRLKISISIQKDKDSHKIVIIYRDSGKGFPKGFDAENQSGIGLMIIKSIVCQEFGGEIQFSNENGAYIIIIINEENFF
ncbi:hypothetical protein EUBC25_18940 [Claveliimonas bilis]|uniref:Histidine kinase domain-containing protein n=1 Tax=Claveliimonas bilis TaxID=3028070 RepID=A0ABM8I5I2_9FIRM|nr:histidine kinase dimerization/phosphoacceptor domain -containing protein [Claveliimonas bilis]BCZ27807.1 hypothetical protein EUBC25_18940 [Claveliimonas bilis]BDZ78381.1 hypothetical protein Lac1_25640 [Claveliimonas bilis]